MTPPPQKIPCSHATRAGRPCRAWAVHGTDPPACVAHSGKLGAPPANQNARSHGFYGTVLQPDELADLVTYAGDLTLDDEIACARVALRRILTLLNAEALAQFEGCSGPQARPPGDYARLAGLALQATRTVARLLRDQRALSGRAADSLASAIDVALDELSTEWDIDL